MTLDCFEYKMQHHCIKLLDTNFLDTTSDDKDLPRFVTKIWVEVYDQSGGNYIVNKGIRIKTSMLRSDLCDFSDAYFVVKEDVTVDAPNNAKRNETLAFKNNASFINCISKINVVKIDNAEDLDVVRAMHNLPGYSKNVQKNNRKFVRITLEMNQVILFLLILNLLNKKQVLQEILITLPKNITDDGGNEVDNPKYDANKVGKNK